MNNFSRISVVLTVLGFLVASIALVYGFSITGKVVEIRPTGMVITDSAGGTVACTADAKLCPDGSYVGRVPPSCNFETCQGCELLWWFDSSNRVCAQKEFCGMYMYQGLQTFETEEGCKAALGECHASGTSCCRGDVCAQSTVAVCTSGVAPKFYGCSDDCTPIWKCEEAVCGNGICEAGEADECPACYYSEPPCLAPCTAGTCPEDCEKQECIAEGQSLGAVVPSNSNVCCAGLTEVSAMSSVGEKCEPMLGNRGYCTNCGNGVCKGPENACNCPKDCGGVVECTDSDGGKNYYLKGTVKTGSQAGTDSCTYCTGACPVTTTAREAEPCVVTCGAVVEYYCNNNGVIAEETFNCPNGCNEGACIGVEKVCTSNSGCGENMFCEFRAGGCGGQGSCVDKPDVCIDLYSPVCGCDGKTYSNDCVRQAAGVSKKSEGKCGEVPVVQCDSECREAGYEYGKCRPGALPETEADRGMWCNAGEVDVGALGCPSLGQVEPVAATTTTTETPTSTTAATVTSATPTAVATTATTPRPVITEQTSASGGSGGMVPAVSTATTGGVITVPSSIGSELNYHCCCGKSLPQVCTPVCKAIGSRSEGWYDSCTGELISYDKCSCLAICRGIGSQTEGYYSSCTEELIVLAKCSISEPVEVTIKNTRVEISQDAAGGVVRITSRESATTQENLKIAEGSLGIVTQDGVKDVNYLPEEAKDKATQYRGFIKVTGIELVDDNGRAVYEVDGKVRTYFLWIIPTSKDATVKVDASTNQVIE